MKKLLPFFVLLLLLVVDEECLAQSGKLTGQLISISFEDDSLSTALTQLQKKVKGDFAYDPAIVPHRKIARNSFHQVSLATVLDHLLEGSDLTYRIFGGAILIERRKRVNYTIDGFILDQASGEKLIGASIYLSGVQLGASTNSYGFYSLTLPEGRYVLTVSALGYSTIDLPIDLSSDLSMDHRLEVKAYDLKEITLQPLATDSMNTALPFKNLPIELLNRLPYYAGEVDLIKALQMQNGIKSIAEGTSGLFVRGGNIDQNLITLDEAMIYNPSHLFGLVSVFNSDAIKKIQIFNDQIPANYGGRLSSVIDIRMADGNNKSFHVKGGLSLLSMRLAAEGPIKKETGSFLVTVRRSLIDLLNQDFKIVNPNSSYYDLNVKANYKLNPSNRIFYSFYFGDDRLFSKNSYNNNWGNVTSTFRWNHEFSARIFSNFSAIYSNYNNLLDVNADTISEKYQWKTGIRDFTLKADFTFYQNPASEIKFGAIGTIHLFTPGEATTAFADYFNIPRDRATESAVYVSHRWSPSRNFQLTYGLRTGRFRNGEERQDVFDKEGNRLHIRDYKTYYGMEPRLHVAYLPGSVHRIHAAYNHNYQYLQLIQNNELPFSSLETWMPSSKKTKPQQSDYWSLGYDYFPGNVNFQVTAYYKKLSRQVELLNHAQVIKNPYVRDQLRSGRSDAYGMELSISKTIGQLSTEAAYTYSRVYRRIQDVNNGQRFRANYDIPHDFKLRQTYSPGERLSFSSLFSLSSGRVATLPVGYFTQEGLRVPIFEGRNSSRFPSFHRWDVSGRWQINAETSGQRTFVHFVSLGVYNVYNRKNPVFFRVRQSTDVDADLFQTAGGMIPWLAYSFNF